MPPSRHPSTSEPPNPTQDPGFEAPPERRASAPRRARVAARALRLAIGFVLAWLILAYFVLPLLWRHYERHPVMESAPKVARTAQGIPGDPLNVGFLGPRETLVRAMIRSGWNEADPITLETSLAIARSVLLDRPDPDAPVSDLYLFGRKQDLAFEKPVGRSADRRHHVRFWEAPEYGLDGQPLWIGAVTYDRSVGLSHRTGQITHHIAPDVDSERDALVADLRANGWLLRVFQVAGVGPTVVGRNGGGDPYFTDGEMTIGVLADAPNPDLQPEILENPLAIRAKNRFWSAIRPAVRALATP